MKVIAIIPARGGSKGVPGKNRRKILGKPLINYTVEKALASNLLSDIWVSSDCAKILECVKEFKGIKVHKRSPELATDNSPITSTVSEILNFYDSQNLPDAIMLLQPTSPIREVSDIDQSITIICNKININSVISVCAMHDIHPARMYWNKNDILEPILGEFETVRRQEIPIALNRNGSIYLVRTESFLNHNSLMAKPSFGYEMSENKLLNIDCKRDMLVAEVLINAWNKGDLV